MKTPVTLVASLESIRPDPGQPRRLLPNDLSEALSRGNLSPLEALQEWLRRAESEQAEPALRHHVRELKRLADSIEHHGLISPISVRAPGSDEIALPGVTYFIVTGERRYWAHVYDTVGEFMLSNRSKSQKLGAAGLSFWSFIQPSPEPAEIHSRSDGYVLEMGLSQPNVAGPTQIKGTCALRNRTFYAGSLFVGLLEWVSFLSLTSDLQGFIFKLGFELQTPRRSFTFGTLVSTVTSPAIGPSKWNFNHLIPFLVLTGMPTLADPTLRTSHRLGLPINGKARQIETLSGFGLPRGVSPPDTF